VVRQHDGVRAVLPRELDVFPRADALDDDWQARGEGFDPRDVGPGEVGVVPRRGGCWECAIQGGTGGCLRGQGQPPRPRMDAKRAAESRSKRGTHRLSPQLAIQRTLVARFLHQPRYLPKLTACRSTVSHMLCTPSSTACLISFSTFALT
jgi:hypothetical protein